jgi:hypothetical protein
MKSDSHSITQNTNPPSPPRPPIRMRHLKQVVVSYRRTFAVATGVGRTARGELGGGGGGGWHVAR